VNLKTETPTAAQLQKVVEEVFENPVYATNVTQLNKEFNEYDPNSLFAAHVASLLKRSKKQERSKKTLEESIY
jgi:UDP:flavonoid glycosyltransferase YjiC (YdhE family)